jgi:hypothetical protein
MTSTSAILLIPAEGDPKGLLAGGPCGARPPLAGRHAGHWYEYEEDGALALAVQGDDGHWAEPACDAVALVLAWNGEPVAAGVDRAWRAFEGSPYLGQGLAILLRSLRDWPDTRGTIVLVDADGKELTP